MGTVKYDEYMEFLIKLFLKAMDEYMNDPKEYDAERAIIREHIGCPEKSFLDFIILGFCLGMANGMKLFEIIEKEVKA